MYEQVLEVEGYEIETRLVDTRPAYLGEMPDAVQIAPEYVAGIVNQLNTDANGPDAADLDERRIGDDRGGCRAAGGEGPDPARPLLGVLGERPHFVSTEASPDVTALSDLKGQQVTLAAAPDCKGRADCEKGLVDTYGIDITLEPLGYASPETFKAVLDGEAQLGQTSTSTARSRSRACSCWRTTSASSPPEPGARRVRRRSSTSTPTSRTRSTHSLAALDNETLADTPRRVQVDRERVEDVAADFLGAAGLL